jgi:PAS domain S-box-containing protein
LVKGDRHIFVNQKMVEMFGYDRPEEIVGQPITITIHPDDQERVKEIKRQRQSGEAVPSQYVFKGQRKNGELIDIEISASKTIYQGEVVSLAYLRDITERKLAEEARRVIDARYRSYIDVTGHLGWATNPDGEVIEDLPSWRKFTGQSKEEIMGSGWSKAIHPDDLEYVFKVWKEAVATKNAYEVEYRIRQYDGAYRHFLARGVPVFKNGGYIREWVGTCIDITDRKRAEEKINTLLKEKELLLQEVHHRIKNNLVTMMSLLTIQSNALEDQKAIAALEDAKGRLQSMSVLYDKLYRTENLREMSIKNYLPALIDEITGIFLNKSSVKIETRIEDFVLGVKVLSVLGIIVNELLTNTMKYAFIGRDDGLITVSATAKDNLATIVFEDNGRGIPESVNIETSTGFGLKLVGMLTKQIDGTIRIERGKGTRFILEFEIL